MTARVVLRGLAALLFFLSYPSAQLLAQNGPKPAEKKDADEAKPLLVNAQLTNADPLDKVRQQSHCKIYSYKMVPGKSYVILLVSNQFDAYLRLEDSKGTQVAADDDSGGNLNAKIEFTPNKADTYKIIATSLGGGSTGAFTLTVTPQGKKKEILNVKDKLTTSDPYDYVLSTSYHKVYQVRMVAGKSYVIDHMSNRFDAYLRFEDFRGNQIAADDDGGVGLNSRIYYNPTVTETYRIIATSLGSNSTGEFQVIVTEQ